MPLIAGLPRGSWSLNVDDRWSFEFDTRADGFVELVGRFVRLASGLGPIRNVSWGSTSAGEDAVVLDVDDEHDADSALHLVVSSGPEDATFVVIGMDLEVELPDGGSAVLPNRVTLFGENEELQGWGAGATIDLVVKTDVLSPFAGGRIFDNRDLAALNRERLSQVLGSVVGELEGGFVASTDYPKTTANGYMEQDHRLHTYKLSGLAAWESLSESAQPSSDERRLLRLRLNDRDLDRLFALIEHGPELRSRYERVVDCLCSPWYPCSDDVLSEAGVRALSGLAAVASPFGIRAWESLENVVPEIVDRSSVERSELNPLLEGAVALGSRLEEGDWGGPHTRAYAECVSSIAENQFLYCFLIAPLAGLTDELDGVFDLWCCGGSMMAHDGKPALIRDWC